MVFGLILIHLFGRVGRVGLPPAGTNAGKKRKRMRLSRRFLLRLSSTHLNWLGYVSHSLHRLYRFYEEHSAEFQELDNLYPHMEPQPQRINIKEDDVVIVWDRTNLHHGKEAIVENADWGAREYEQVVKVRLPVRDSSSDGGGEPLAFSARDLMVKSETTLRAKLEPNLVHIAGVRSYKYGEVVTIVKTASQFHNTATVVDALWHGRVQVQMNDGEDSGRLKSYTWDELASEDQRKQELIRQIVELQPPLQHVEEQLRRATVQALQATLAQLGGPAHGAPGIVLVVV